MLVIKTKYQKLSRLAFAPDGRGLAAAGRWGAYFWRSVFDDPRPERFGEGQCTGVGFTPDRAHLLTVVNYNHLLTIRLNEPSSSTTTELPLSYMMLAVCPATGLAVVQRWSGGEMAGWRVGPDGAPQRAWAVNTQPGNFDARVAFAPDGSWFVRTARDPNPRLVLADPATGRETGSRTGLDWVSCGPAVAPDNDRLAFGSGSTLEVRALTAPDWRTRHQNDNTHQYTDLAFHPSGRFLAVTNTDATVKLYDTATWEVARTFTWDIGRMRSIAFSPDGTLAAAGSDTGKVVVWDVDG